MKFLFYKKLCLKFSPDRMQDQNQGDECFSWFSVQQNQALLPSSWTVLWYQLMRLCVWNDEFKRKIEPWLNLGYSKDDNSILIRAGLPGLFSTQPRCFPLINQWNAQCSWIEWSVILKTDQGFTRSWRVDWPLVTQLQAIEKKFKHWIFFWKNFN